MGINDIEQKILDDAKNAAALIVQAAHKLKQDKLAAVKKELAAEKNLQENKLEQFTVKAIEQKKQLLQMESDQLVLKAKRAQLQNVYQEIIKDISSDAGLLKKYSKAIGAELKKQGYTEEIDIDKKQASKPLEFKIGNAVVKTSTADFVLDNIKDLEAEAASILFS